METAYEVMQEEGHVPVKSWTRGVPFDDNSKQQLRNIASMPFIHKWVAAMPDVHLGKGATIGSVIPTLGAIIPAAVGGRYWLWHDGCQDQLASGPVTR